VASQKHSQNVTNRGNVPKSQVVRPVCDCGYSQFAYVPTPVLGITSEDCIVTATTVGQSFAHSFRALTINYTGFQPSTALVCLYLC